MTSQKVQAQRPTVQAKASKTPPPVKPDASAQAAMTKLGRENTKPGSISGKQMADAIVAGTKDLDNQAAGSEFKTIQKFVETHGKQLSPEAKKVFDVYAKQAKLAQANGSTGIDFRAFKQMQNDMNAAAKPGYQDAGAAAALKDLAAANPKPGSISGKEMTDAILTGTKDLDNQAAGKEFADISKFVKENAQLLSPEAKKAYGVYEAAAKAAQAKGQTGIAAGDYQRMARDMMRASAPPPPNKNGIEEIKKGLADEAKSKREEAASKRDGAKAAREGAQGHADIGKGIGEIKQGRADEAKSKLEAASGKAHLAQGAREEATAKREDATAAREMAQGTGDIGKGSGEIKAGLDDEKKALDGEKKALQTEAKARSEQAAALGDEMKSQKETGEGVDAIVSGLMKLMSGDLMGAIADFSKGAGLLNSAAADHSKSLGEGNQATADLAAAKSERSEAKGLHDKARGELTEGVKDLAKGLGELGQGIADHGQAVKDHQAAAADFAAGRGLLNQSAADHSKAQTEIKQGASDVGKGLGELRQSAADAAKSAAEHKASVADHRKGQAEVRQGVNDLLGTRRR